MEKELLTAATEWLALNKVVITPGADVKQLVDDRYWGGWEDFESDYLTGLMP